MIRNVYPSEGMKMKIKHSLNKFTSTTCILFSYVYALMRVLRL